MSGLFVREIIGWALMLLGLSVFRVSLQYLGAGLVIEGMIAAIIGIMPFRGGLQLVKVAVAARAFHVDREAIADSVSIAGASSSKYSSA